MRGNTDGMVDLFGDAGITVVDTGHYKETNDNKARCYSMNFKEMLFQDPLDLFEGEYTDLKVITFSFDFNFAARLSSKFKTVDIVVGAEFLSEKINKSLTEQMAYILASAHNVKRLACNNQEFAKRVIEGEVNIKCPKFLCDHRKIYLLKADNGRTRVIFPSANLSGSAWNVNHHIEDYPFCDDNEFYEMVLQDFKTIQSLSSSVVLDANVQEDTAVMNENDPVSLKENPIIEEAAKYVDTAIVVQKVDNPETKLTIVNYNKDMEEFEPLYKECLKNTRLKENKDGYVVITAKTINKILVNEETCRLKKVTVEQISEGYPRMNIDYGAHKVFIGNEELDLSPSDDEVKTDISLLLGAFENYKSFVPARNILPAQHNHFKLLNAMFSSVFNAIFRCRAKVKRIEGLSALPLYMLLNSKADGGKTFMVRLGLKMMTGKEVNGYKYEQLGTKTVSKGDHLAAYQESHQCIPIFVDEVDKHFVSSFGKMIKSPQSCEEHMRENQPLVIFASNDNPSPQKEFRKRMIFLTYNIKFPSKQIRREYETLGGHIIHRMGNAFYRKYLSMMLPYVIDELDKIDTSKDLSDTYSPELMKRSSEIILDIIRQYGYEVPKYMKVLSWDEDYGDNSRPTYEEALDEIKDLYRSNRKMFKVEEKFVIICLDKNIGEKLCTKWANSLPNELCATIIPDTNCAKIRFDRTELEYFLGFKFDTGLRAKIKNLLS